jgi:hypothetical protein
MALLTLWLATYLPVALILAGAWLVGYPLVRRVVSGPLGAILSVITGVAVLMWWVAVLAWIHQFRLLAMLALVAVGAVATARVARSAPPALVGGAWRGRRIRGAPAVVVGVLGAALAEMSLLPLYPWLGFDSSYYHLPLARNLIVYHGFVDDHARYGFFFPQANEALFATGKLLFPSDRVAHGLEFSLLALAVAVVAAWFLTTGRGAVGAAVAGVLVLASPTVISSGTTAYVDVWTLLFVASGLVVAGIALEREGERPWFAWALCGLLLGSAASAKYPALAIIGLAIVFLFMVTRRERIERRGVLVAGLIALAVLFPWYANTVRATGDPVYPFLASKLGSSGPWTSSEISFWKRATRGTSPGVRNILRVDLDYLRGRVAGDLPLGLRPLHPLVLIGAFGVMFRPLLRQRIYLVCLLTGCSFVALWVIQSADPRYVIPALGPLAMAAGLVATEIRGRVGDRLLVRPAVFLAAPLLAGAILLPSLNVYYAVVINNGAPPTTSAAQRGWINDRLTCISGVNYLNQVAGTDYVVYGAHCEIATYFARGTFLGQYFDDAGYLRTLGPDGGLPSPPVLAERLHRLDVGFLLLPDGVGDPAQLADSGLFTRVFDDTGSHVLRLN